MILYICDQAMYHRQANKNRMNPAWAAKETARLETVIRESLPSGKFHLRPALPPSHGALSASLRNLS